MPARHAAHAVAAPAPDAPAKIPITRPYFDDAERQAIVQPLDTGWVVQGPHVAEFEARLQAFTGAPHAIATTSCTTALHLAVAALGLAPGDEVVVPAFTWISTANVVEYMGAKPVFVDVDLDTYNLDPAALDGALGDRTVGILPVHLFGLSAEMDPILKTAAAHDLWTVEDAACAFGTRYRGRHAGTLGDAGCFSFHPRKSITTGEGGCLTTRDDARAAHVRALREHGATTTDHARHHSAGGFRLPDYRHLGYNYRMTDLQAAVGCAQMDKAERILRLRHERARRYTDLLESVPDLTTPTVPTHMVHGWQAYVCRYAPETPSMDNVDRLQSVRDHAMAALEQDGIATRCGTHAAAHQTYYADKYDIRPRDLPNAYIAERTTITLPLYPQMTDDEQDRVVARLRHHLNG